MLLTPKKAAEFVKVDEATILGWIEDGRLVGGRSRTVSQRPASKN